MYSSTNTNLCLCGPRSGKSVTGVALAFDLLIEGLEDKAIQHKVVDMTRGAFVSKAGSFSVLRAWDTLVVVLLVWRHLFYCKVYYATMSTSSFGFIRDYLTIGMAKLLGRRTAASAWRPWSLRTRLLIVPPL